MDGAQRGGGVEGRLKGRIEKESEREARSEKILILGGEQSFFFDWKKSRDERKKSESWADDGFKFHGETGMRFVSWQWVTSGQASFPLASRRQGLVTKCVPRFRAGHFGLKSEIINTEVSRAQAELKSESSVQVEQSTELRFFNLRNLFWNLIF
jgi:hypothetical protein